MMLFILTAENIPREIRLFIGNKNMKTSTFIVQAYNLIMCGYFFIEFTDHMLAGKTLIDYTSLFLSHGFKKNKITLSHVKNG